MKSSLPAVAIIGRPNVGKSTLFNVLTRPAQGQAGGGQQAVTHGVAGTTRDVRRTPAELFGLQFLLLDTAGIEQGRTATDLQKDISVLALKAAQQADAILLVLDGDIGLTPADRALAQTLRKLGKPLLVALNKADLKTAQSHIADVETLGLGSPLMLSAAHGLGMEQLHDALAPHLPQPEPAPQSEPEADDAQAEPEEGEGDEADTPRHRFRAQKPAGPVKVAILGRPNVGKSTLINALLGQQAMLTGPTAGLTREAIHHTFTFGDAEFELIDTPGLRRKAKVSKDDVEFLSVGQSLQAAEKAHVIVLVVDASTHNIATGNWRVFEQQDAQIASLAMHQFKPIVIALNKWDAVTDKKACMEDITIQLNHRLHAINQPLAMPISALKSKGLKDLMQAVVEVNDAAYRTYSTGKLNALLSQTLAKRSPPLANGKAVTLKFIRQTDANPPTFTFWGNRINQVSGSYKQFLRNQLAQVLGLQHNPVKILFRANANPYAPRS